MYILSRTALKQIPLKFREIAGLQYFAERWSALSEDPSLAGLIVRKPTNRASGLCRIYPSLQFAGSDGRA